MAVQLSGQPGQGYNYQPYQSATTGLQPQATTQTQAQAPVATSAAATGTSSLFQPAYLGAPATVDPAFVNAPTSQGTSATAAQLDPSLLSSLSPTATIQQLLQGFAPQEQQGQNQLSQMLANFGVGGGQAVGAESQFQGQEAAGIAPAIAAAIQNAQGNSLNAGEFDTGNQQATGIFNAQQGQQNNQFNAGNALTAGLNNQSSANSAANTNAQAINATNAANVGEQNQAQQQEIQDLLNQYYAQLGAFSNINTAGQGAANTNATNYGQDITVSDPFADIFGPIVGAAGTAATGKL
jgi:hypothetical protein